MFPELCALTCVQEHHFGVPTRLEGMAGPPFTAMVISAVSAG
jgi:hypothetical protein